MRASMDLMSAKEYWIKRSKLNEKNGRNHFYIAPFYQISGDSFHAMRHHQLALKYDPLDPNIRNDFGLFLMKQRKFNEAKEQFQKAIQLDPNFLLALNNLSALYARQGKFTEAKTCCEKVIRKDPKNSMAHRNLAKLLEETCNTHDALKHNMKAIQLDEGKDAYNRYDRSKHADVYRIVARQHISRKQNENECAHQFYDKYRALANQKVSLPTSVKTRELLEMFD